MIAAPIVAATMPEAEEQLREAARQGVDLVELRLDAFRERFDLAALLAAAPVPAIVTCRPRWAGGSFDGTEEARIRHLRRAVTLGAAYVDCESEIVTKVRARGGTRIIASYHNFGETPTDLGSIVRAMEHLPAAVVKFATQANDLADTLRVWEAVAACGKPAIGLCMGEFGEASRILALHTGSLLTFGSLGTGLESAPGQLTARDLKELYRADTITPATELYAVAGDPIAHSMSPAIHNAAFAHLGLDATYLRFRVGDFPSFLETIAPAVGLRGVSVTIPHKHAALAAAARVETAARRIGAVNTLRRLDAGWEGSNTDCAAALGAIRNAARRAGLRLPRARALILGAGGTARALAVGLGAAGCSLVFANRTRSRAEALAREFSGEVVDLALAHTGRYGVIANTTAVGMHPREEATPVDPSVFRKGMVVFDAVYNPPTTRLLREAKRAGATVATGLDMFVGQAARQFELWTGWKAPRRVMRRVVTERLAAGRSAQAGD
jgi:3-dehydroquinate dehydratase/shikimate dehydrogenase